MKRILVIDNYDSFTYTIVFYLKELGYKCKVIKGDSAKNAKELERFTFSHLLISPGPNAPSDARLSLKAIKYFKKRKKILGICLGHQCIAQIFGGKVSQLKNPTHGKISTLYFKNDRIFKNLKKHSKICLYHSLHISKMPKNCQVLARDERGVIMAIKHKKYHIYGLQFHPEAILSQGGKKILKNFMRL